MYIKSIFVEGFKSYAKRTEICGFDPAFNAITGLNGSGKSNILDSICFLLGISNLSQVRASSMQDLVYKGGQAGVTKATVSIIFDNNDKKFSPIGYENFDELTITRQIVIGGKNKYLINGINATNTRVHDLFRSVQLNVNNPHFLIMQGRITKVLNMKPPEILSLLEEAVSTKLYEAKREDTLKTIEKKDVKLKEIDKILREEIKPTLNKLREERSSYMEYQKVVRELEYLNKFLIAYDFVNKKAIVDNSEGELARMRDQQTAQEQLIIQCDNDTQKTLEEIDAKFVERNEEITVKLDQLTLKHSDLQKAEAILKNAVKRNEEEVKDTRKELKTMEKQSIEDREAHGKLETEIKNLESKFNELQDSVNKSRAGVEMARNHLNNVNSGFFQSETGGQTGSLSELLAVAEKHESSLEIDLNVLKMKANHLINNEKQLAVKLSHLNKSESAELQEKKHGELTREIDRLEKSAVKLGYSDSDREKMIEESRSMSERLRQVIDDKDRFIRDNWRLNFVYKRPSPNFDESRVIGTIASLITLKRPEFAIALEVATLPKLYNVVVDTNHTAVELISKDCLPNRTTFLPLNDISYHLIPNDVYQRAQKILGSNNVWSPMDIIEFDQRYFSAVANAFGGFLIARDLNMANTVAFDSRIRCRCVTLDGEIFDPEGTLIGGNTPTCTRIFERAKHLSDLENSLKTINSDKIETDKRLANMNNNRQRYDSIQKDLAARQMELRQLERRMMENDYLEIQKNLTDARNELKSVQESISSKSQQYDIAKKKTLEARENVANSASIQERAQKTAQLSLKTAQDQLIKDEDIFKEVEMQYESLKLELSENENEKKNFQSTYEATDKLLKTKLEELQESNTNLLNHNEKLKQSKYDVEEQKKLLKSIDAKISQLQNSKTEYAKMKDQATLKLSEVNHRITCHKKDSEDAGKKVEKMLHKYNWIADEQKYFNQSDGIYDFAKRDWREAQQKIEQLEDQKRKLSRKVDLRGMNVLGQTEQRYDELLSKYNKVLQDKKVLQTVIDDLDKMKDSVIQKAHEQVDKNFDKIFSTLLPGSRARLVPPEGKSITEGLEFKISFGNVWKDSLNELSGGQRSLVALSLILALLQFKPAPLYILDEVDAALDISHTQNIGTIIKEQFSNSQFIIVSLKDGMFNNANVLFKTKFVDGVSTVTRHVNTARRPMTEKNN